MLRPDALVAMHKKSGAAWRGSADAAFNALKNGLQCSALHETCKAAVVWIAAHMCASRKTTSPTTLAVGFAIDLHALLLIIDADDSHALSPMRQPCHVCWLLAKVAETLEHRCWHCGDCW